VSEKAERAAHGSESGLAFLFITGYWAKYWQDQLWAWQVLVLREWLDFHLVVIANGSPVLFRLGAYNT
jgi:hypothetical protein